MALESGQLGSVSWGSRSSFRGAGRRLGLRGLCSAAGRGQLCSGASTWSVTLRAARRQVSHRDGEKPASKTGRPPPSRRPRWGSHTPSPTPSRPRSRHCEIMGISSSEMTRTHSPSPSKATEPAQTAVPVTGNAGVAGAGAQAGSRRVTPLPGSLAWPQGRRGRERPPPLGHGPRSSLLAACCVCWPWTRGVLGPPGRRPRGLQGGGCGGLRRPVPLWSGQGMPSARPMSSVPASPPTPASPGAPAPDLAIGGISARTVMG